MLDFLMPRVHSFYEKFEKHAELVVEGTRLLRELLDDLGGSERKARRIKEVEHEADVITHQTVEMLHTTFVTPFDRDTILRLVSRMDDILDQVEAAAERLWLYELHEAMDEARELSRILQESAEGVQRAVRGLSDLKKRAGEIRKVCVHVNRLENDADAVLRGCLARLFREETDPLAIMKWKEICEILEGATDRCEDVADVVEGVILEYA